MSDKNVQLEKLLKQIEDAKEDIASSLKKQEGELKETKETSAKTAKAIEEANGRFDEAVHEVKELSTRLDALELLVQRPPDDQPTAGSKSMGQIFSDSEEFKTMQKSGVRESALCKELKSFAPWIRGSIGGFAVKELAEVSLDTDSAGDALDPFRRPGFIAPPLYARRLRNLIPTLNTNQGAVEFVKESNFYQLLVLIDSSSASGQKVVNVANVSGFYVGQTVTIAPGEGDEEEHILAAVSSAADAPNGDYTGTITTTVNLANTHTAGTKVVSDDYVFTPETFLKPSAEIVLTLVSEPMKTLAHALAASRQVLSDITGLRAHIDSRMLESLILSEEKQMLYGAGGTTELSGIMVDADVQNYAWSSGPSGDTKLDAIRRSMTLSTLAHYPVDGVVVHPSDWEDMQLAKGSDGHYIWASVPSLTGDTIWRAPVVETTAINSGDALVGAFRLGAAIWDAEEAGIRMSESHDNFFLRNMIAILAEERLLQTIYRPESFVNVDLSTAP